MVWCKNQRMDLNDMFRYYAFKCKHWVSWVKMYVWYCITPSVPFRLYKIIHYCDRNNVQNDVTKMYHKGEQTYLETEDWIEYRLYYFDKQYRVLSSCFNRIDPSMTTFKKNKIRDPVREPYVIYASLEYKDHLEDVYDRVEKYLGPCKDFFGQSVKMKWMFVNDDLEDENILHLLLSDGTTLSYTRNDMIKVS